MNILLFRSGHACLVLASAALALTFLFGGHAAAADELKVVAPETVGLVSERLEAITTELRKSVQDGKIAGAVTLIGRHGQIAHFEAVGYRDVESKSPMRRDALFRIASMTKVATAVAALSLHEEGRFKLDEDAAGFVLDLRQCRVKAPAANGSTPADSSATVPLQRPITIRDLLRHTSGFTYGSERGSPVEILFRERAVWKEVDGLKGLVEALTQTPLAFQPGTDFRYSFSSDVLGCLLENVTQRPLDEVLRQRVFEPLGMTDTDFHVREGQAARLTSYYQFEHGRLALKESATNSPFLNRPKSFSGGGGWPDGHAGLLSTATDWWRLCEMIRQRGQLNGVRVLQEDTIALMVTNQLAAIGPGFMPKNPGLGYGLSVGVVVDRELANNPGSNGQVFWAGGPYNTCFFIDGEEELVGILLLQTSPWRHLNLMDRFNELAHQTIASPAGPAGDGPNLPGRERGGRAESTPDLQVSRLAEGVWLHTSWHVVPGGTRYPSNGLLVREGGGLTLVDTAWGEHPTRDLLAWVARELKLPVSRAIVTHAHDDRMGGAPVLSEHGIPVLSHPLTGELAAKQGWPRPAPLTSLSNAGSATNIGAIEVFFPGPAHTVDNLMVWIPHARILFGGCAVKELNSRNLGNVADADVAAWPEAIRRAQERYASRSAMVVPGHGEAGDAGLLRHTLALCEDGNSQRGAAKPPP